MNEIRPIQWADGKLNLLDQTRLPGEEVTVQATSYEDAVDAIREMRVRGAPAIGVTAAYAVVLAAQDLDTSNREDFLAALGQAADRINLARPTAEDHLVKIPPLPLRLREGILQGDANPISQWRGLLLKFRPADKDMCHAGRDL